MSHLLVAATAVPLQPDSRSVRLLVRKRAHSVHNGPRLARTRIHGGMQPKAHRSRVRTWHATVLLYGQVIMRPGHVAPGPSLRLGRLGRRATKVQAAARGGRGVPRGPNQCRGGKRPLSPASASCRRVLLMLVVAPALDRGAS